METGRVVTARQPPQVVRAPIRIVALYVGRVPLAELVDGGQDGRVAAVRAHRRAGEVGVAAGAVPVARHRLRVERDGDAELFGDPEQNVARHPQMIAALDALANTCHIIELSIIIFGQFFFFY